MKQLLKYPGSKWRYAKWICSMFPEHHTYLEPFFGSGAVFFHKAPSKREIINDLDWQVVNFFKVLREQPEALARAVELTPYSRAEYNAIREDKGGAEIHLTGDSLEDARRFMIRCHQSFGAKLADRSGWKTAMAINAPNVAQIWRTVPECIMTCGLRIKQAQIECLPAIEVIQRYNFKECLMYVDPPYPQDVRNSRLYRKEMMMQTEHKALLEVLKKHKGTVILSGYDNTLYNAELNGWHKAAKKGYTAAGTERTEILWMNFTPQEQLQIIA